MADVQIAVIDDTENVVNVAVPGIQGPIGTTGSVTIAQAGTAATPGIRFESDTNTGIYSPGADQLAISTGGTGRLFVDGNGNVGVGGAPTQKFVVFGNARVETTSTGNVGLEMYNGTRNTGVSSDFANSLTFVDHNQVLIFRDSQNAYAERLRITSAGLVGIGTSSPGSILDVKVTDSNTTIGGSASVIRVNNGSGILGSTSGLEFFHGNDTSSNVARLAGVYGRYSSFNASGLGGELVFATNTAGDSTIDERMRITSTGNVGIGTSSPDSVLSINGASALGALGSGAPAITLKNTDTTNFNAAQIVNRDSGGNIAGGISFRNLSHGASGNSDLVFHIRNAGTVRESLAIGATGTTTLNAAASTAPFIAQINSSEAARIDGSGRLLVGTSTSISGAYTGTSRFQSISTSSAPYYTGGFFGYHNDVNATVIQIGHSRSSSPGHTILQSGDGIGTLRFEGSDGVGFIESAAISAFVDGTPGTNDMPGRLVFATTADGAASPTERLRITSAGVLQVADAGNITVGTTTGTKIGTGTTQKLGFYNATPVVQPTAVADATDAASAITQLNALLTRMRNLGLIAT